MENTFWYLEKSDLSSLVHIDKLQQQLSNVETLTFEKGDFIIPDTKRSDMIFYITKGRVTTGTHNDQGTAVPIATLQKGDLFGPISGIKHGSRDDYAQATEAVETSLINLQILKDLLIDPSMANALLMKMMGARMTEMESRLESLLFKDSKSRIIEYIIKTVEKSGQRIGYEWVVRNFSTHLDVANLTATSRQTVTMVLNELRNENIIHFDRKRLLIRDLDMLKSRIQNA